MNKCVAKGCINSVPRSSEEEVPEDVSFHPFPKNPTLKNKWIKQMNQEGFVPGPTSVLCSLHFIREYFTDDEVGVFLKPDAIPTEFELDAINSNLEDEVIRCCAYKCTNIYSPESTTTFHPFPLEQPELCDQWLLAMNVTQVAAKQAVLCSEHFDESCFVQGENGERLIMADAVPSIFVYPEDDASQSATESMLDDPPPNSDVEMTNNTVVKTESLDGIAIEIIQKHDELVTELLGATERLTELAQERIALEKEKKDLDLLMKIFVNNGFEHPSDKEALKRMKAMIHNIDEIGQQIVADTLAPCISTGNNELTKVIKKGGQF